MNQLDKSHTSNLYLLLPRRVSIDSGHRSKSSIWVKCMGGKRRVSFQMSPESYTNIHLGLMNMSLVYRACTCSMKISLNVKLLCLRHIHQSFTINSTAVHLMKSIQHTLQLPELLEYVPCWHKIQLDISTDPAHPNKWLSTVWDVHSEHNRIELQTLNLIHWNTNQPDTSYKWTKLSLLKTGMPQVNAI